MKNENLVWFNGTQIPWSSATVPVLSHSFSRASAIFEIFRVHAGPHGPAAFRMDAHLERLLNSARLLDMPLCHSKAEIARAVSETVTQNNVESGVVKIMAYWGEEALIELVPQSKPDMAIFAVKEGPEMRLDDPNPVTTCLSKWKKLAPQTVPVEAKACANYLNGYLARKDAIVRGFDVGIMLDTDEHLAESSVASVFIVQNQTIKIPPPGGVLGSISRMSVLEVARSEGFHTVETLLDIEDLYSADEIFLSHTGVKVQPVKQFEDKDLTAPGPVTRSLMNTMEKILSFQNRVYAKWMQSLAI